jgi:hypothetical protein
MLKINVSELRKKYLSGERDFEKINLEGANLQGLNLAGINFSNANLKYANLEGCNLQEACLKSAKIKEAYLSGAYYDERTQFDINFNPQTAGMFKSNKTPTEIDIEISELLGVFNYICQCSNRYLGHTVTIRYLENSRPSFRWLEKFTIDLSGQIIFEGNSAYRLSNSQLQYLQLWIESFIQSCTTIIRDFPSLIENKQSPFSKIIFDN